MSAARILVQGQYGPWQGRQNRPAISKGGQCHLACQRGAPLPRAGSLRQYLPAPDEQSQSKSEGLRRAIFRPVSSKVHSTAMNPLKSLTAQISTA